MLRRTIAAAAIAAAIAFPAWGGRNQADDPPTSRRPGSGGSSGGCAVHPAEPRAGMAPGLGVLALVALVFTKPGAVQSGNV